MRDFKYKTNFNKCFVKASIPEDSDKFLSKASLEKLKGLGLPNSLDLNHNLDLIGVICNGAVVNRINANSDGIDTQTALAIKDLFVHKPFNKDHIQDDIVGHIVKVGFSRFGTNEILSDEEVKDMTEPFNMVIASVVYRAVDQKFAHLLTQSSNKESEYYNFVSSSWEIGFEDYYITVGSKNINESRIITDPFQMSKYEKYLITNGGKGITEDGLVVGRVIKGDKNNTLPYGFAFTPNPAAEVKGVITIDGLLEEFNQEEDTLSTDENKENLNEDSFINKKNEITHSNLENNSVNKNETERFINMKINSIEDILKLLPSEKADASREVSNYLNKVIEDASDKWKAEREEKEESLKKIQAEFDKTKLQAEEANKKIELLNAEIEDLKEKSRLQEIAAKFQERMSAIDSEFELSEKETQIVAKQVKSISSDEEYEAWLEDFSVFNENKKRSFIEAKKNEEEQRKAKASVKKEEQLEETEKAKKAEEALAAAKEKENQSVASNQSNLQTDLANEWDDAFKGNIQIKY